MKKLIVLIWVIVFTVSVFSQVKFEVSKSETVLISVGFAGWNKKVKNDEALLITDKKEVAYLKSLFNGNATGIRHACSYHWQINFFQMVSEKTTVWFNQDCENFVKNTKPIHRFLQPKFRQIENKPTHFLTNLEIDVNTEPEIVAKEVEAKTNHKVYFLENLEKRFPFITITYEAKSLIPDDKKLWQKAEEANENKVKDVLLKEIESLKKKYKIVSNTEPNRETSMFGGGEIFDRFQTTIYFPVGTSLEGIASYLKSVKLKDKAIPTIYLVQIVANKRLDVSEKKGLMDSFSFIKKISTYE